MAIRRANRKPDKPGLLSWSADVGYRESGYDALRHRCWSATEFCEAPGEITKILKILPTKAHTKGEHSISGPPIPADLETDFNADERPNGHAA
jgi:hypothetical protein